MSDPATSQVIAASIPDEEEERQLDLLDAPVTERGQQLVAHVKRAPGRPPGSRNKVTERTVTWLLGKHRDPREALLAVVDMHPADLAGLLGCSLAEAQAEIRLCAQAVLPYVAKKMPLDIDVSATRVIHLTIGELAPEASPQAAEEAALTIAGQFVEIMENQGVGDDAPAEVGRDGVGQND